MKQQTTCDVTPTREVTAPARFKRALSLACIVTLGLVGLGEGSAVAEVSEPAAVADVSVSSGGFSRGTTATFTHTLHNLGPDPATGVHVVVSLDAGVVTTTQGFCLPNGLLSWRCAVGTIAPGASVAITARVGTAVHHVSMHPGYVVVGYSTSSAEVTAAPFDPVLDNNRSATSTYGTVVLEGTCRFFSALLCPPT